MLFLSVPMVFFEVLRTGSLSQIKLNTLEFSALFDMHAAVCGKNYRFASFASPKKPLKLVFRKFVDVDYVFVTSSSTIGVLFLKNTRIYITRPVFEQLVLKYEQLRDLSVSYDEMTDEEIRKVFFDNEDAISTIKHGDDAVYQFAYITDVDINDIRKQVTFISYNHVTTLGSYRIQSIPSGTYIGSCNYLITFPNTLSLTILTSYSSKRRFSIEATPITSDYLLINRKFGTQFESIHKLTDYIKEYSRLPSSEVRPLLIPVEFTTFFIELLFHILSLISTMSIPVTIVSSTFSKLDLFLNLHSEWLNKDFFTISEPFPVRKYPKLNVVESMCDVEMTKNFVFCSSELYELLKYRIRDIFDVLMVNEPECAWNYDAQRPLAALHKPEYVDDCNGLPGIDQGATDAPCFTSFNLKIESSNQEILSMFNGTQIDLTSFHLNAESDYVDVWVDSSLPVVGNNVVLCGDLCLTDFDLQCRTTVSLKSKKSFIHRMLEEEKPIFVGGWYVLPINKIKFRPINNNQIEYSHTVPKSS